MADEKKTVDLTEVVEQAAQFQYERFLDSDDPDTQYWVDLPPFAKFHIKEVVTPLVVEVLRIAGVETS
jgi:hypothetical protein